MNNKSTLGLFAALVVLLGAAAWFLLTGPKPGDESLLLPSAKALKLEAKDFDKLTIERKKPTEETLTFVRTGKSWRLEKPIDTKASASSVDGLIDALIGARREGKDEGTKNLADLGLDSPSAIITLTRGSGQTLTVSLGKATRVGAGEVYALSSDRKEPLVLKKSALSSLLKQGDKEAGTAGELIKPAADFRGKDLMLEGAGLTPADDVSKVTLGDGKLEMILVKNADNTWKFEKPDTFGAAETRGDAGTGAEPGPPAGVDPLIAVLAAIKPAAGEDFIDAVTDFAQYGLEDGKLAGPKASLVRKGAKAGETMTETLLVGKKDDASKKYFVRLAGEKTVAKVAENLIEPLLKALARPGALRDKQLLAFNPTGCDAVDIKIEDKPLELRKVANTWKLYESDGSSQAAFPKTIMELLGALSGRPVKDFPEANATDAILGFDRPSAEITLWVAGLLPDEKKDEKAGPTKPKLKDPAARLVFGKRDKDLLYVRRILKDKDGKETKADFAVSESLMPKIARGRMEYLDPTLPSFVNANATKLTFNRGEVTYTIEKSDKGWVIKAPAELANKAADAGAVDLMLSDLSALRAERLWSDKPNERELERYGLKVPKLKATVTVKDGEKTADRLFSVGGETDDKTGIYVKQGERDLVFVASPTAFQNVQTRELRAMEVYQVDLGKVVGLKLSGWKDVLGQPATREFERKGSGTWSMKGDAPVKLNPSQCEAFLANIAAVRAEKFVPAKDDQKLTQATGALEIQILIDGAKDPVTLTIGGLDATKASYFATSNQLSGDVFLLLKGPFEALKAKPGYFAAE